MIYYGGNDGGGEGGGGALELFLSSACNFFTLTYDRGKENKITPFLLLLGGN
jgi:hypothetical protein